MTLDGETISAALADLHLGHLVAIAALSGGTSPVFRLDFDSQVSVTLKVYPDSDGAIGRDSFAAGQLRHIGVPVTRTLLVDETRARLPFRFAVTTHLPGVAAGSLKAHPDIASLYRQAGSLLRELHEVAMPAYGPFGPEGIDDPVASNGLFMRRLIDDAFEQFSAFGAEPRLVDRLRIVVEAHFNAVTSASRGPVFAHDDLHPNNLLAVEDGQGHLTLSGLIDFGNARAADAVFDLAKCLFCFEHDAPGSTVHVLSGYGPIGHPDPDLAVWHYTIIHRMVMWWWLRRVGVIASADTPSDLMDRLRDVAFS